MREKLRWILVGDRSESISTSRRALLTAFSLLFSILTCVYYVTINSYHGYNPAVHFYYLYMAVAFIAFLLNRAGRHRMAKIIFLVCVNLVVFAFSSREPPIPAAFLFFIVISLVPLIIFDGRDKYLAAVFVGVSLFLYFIARFTAFSIVPYQPIDADYLAKAYDNNLMIVFLLSVMAVYFLVIINNSVETSLENREKQIQEKNQSLLKTNEELDRFIYSTSHDLRAPLTSIQGLINLSALSPTKEEQNTYHQMMRERLFKLEAILNEIMQYSKNAKLEVEHKSIDVRQYVQQALSDVRYQDGAGKVKVNVVMEEPLTLVTDPMRFAIILNNLVSNAIKYSDLTKGDSFVTIRADKGGNQFVMTMEDNGEGIESKHQEKIFSMFYRATTRSTGSGLGLYLVKEAVDKLGGSVHVVSQYGKGTTFRIELPVIG